jgi:hypothetical protein
MQQRDPFPSHHVMVAWPICEVARMSAEYALTTRSELLALVVRRLHAEFPTVAADQVVRSVQIARDAAKSANPTEAAAADPTAYVNIVETQARHYLAKFQAIRAKSPLPRVPTVIELGAAERQQSGRHRREVGAVNVLPS